MESLKQGFCECGCGQLTNLARRTWEDKGWVKGQPLSFINRHHLKSFWKEGKENPRWKGGIYVDIHGYKKVLCKKHPRADPYGYVFEHILVAEKALSKPLPPLAQIHHWGSLVENGKIVICNDPGYHVILHRRAKALKECGHADWKNCWICKKYDKPENLLFSRNAFRHRICGINHFKEYRQKRKEETLWTQ